MRLFIYVFFNTFSFMQTYTSYEKLKEKLLKAIEETEGFGQE